MLQPLPFPKGGSPEADRHHSQHSCCGKPEKRHSRSSEIKELVVSARQSAKTRPTSLLVPRYGVCEARLTAWIRSFQKSVAMIRATGPKEISDCRASMTTSAVTVPRRPWEISRGHKSLATALSCLVRRRLTRYYWGSLITITCHPVQVRQFSSSQLSIHATYQPYRLRSTLHFSLA